MPFGLYKYLEVRVTFFQMDLDLHYTLHEALSTIFLPFNYFWGVGEWKSP